MTGWIVPVTWYMTRCTTVRAITSTSKYYEKRWGFGKMDALLQEFIFSATRSIILLYKNMVVCAYLYIYMYVCVCVYVQYIYIYIVVQHWVVQNKCINVEAKEKWNDWFVSCSVLSVGLWAAYGPGLHILMWKVLWTYMLDGLLNDFIKSIFVSLFKAHSLSFSLYQKEIHSARHHSRHLIMCRCIL